MGLLWLEGAFEHLDRSTGDRHNVESELFSTPTMFAKPRGCETAYPLLFVDPDRFGRTPKEPRRTSLHLDERHGVSSTDHEVEFATATSPVLVENDPAALFVPTGGEFFALPPQFLSCKCHEQNTTKGV